MDFYSAILCPHNILLPINHHFFGGVNVYFFLVPLLQQAINNIKANAAGLTRVNNVKAESTAELPKSKPEHSTYLRGAKDKASGELPKAHSPSVLPPDFFDNKEAKRQKTGKNLS